MNKDTLRQLLVAVSVLAVIVVNGLATALPLNGQTTGEISDRFEVFFVPAGYVFSIWGLIYLGLIAYAVYQALPAQKTNEDLRGIGYLFVFSSAANIAWIFLWHYEFFPLTIVAMLALLGSLVAIYLRLDTGRAAVSSGMKWLVHLPFSVYLGWITVATIANVTSLLYFLEWSGWGVSPEAWTLIMLAAAVVIGAAVSLTRGDVAYALVLIWAFAGIAVKHQDTTVVATAAWLAAAITAIFMFIGVFRGRQQRRAVAAAAGS
jgi:benzodiazapine receptor